MATSREGAHCVALLNLRPGRQAAELWVQVQAYGCSGGFSVGIYDDRDHKVDPGCRRLEVVHSTR